MLKTLATVTVDRLLRHAHICQTTGESVRLSLALTRRGDATALTRQGDATALTWNPCAPVGLMGSFRGHQWTETVATSGQVLWPPMCGSPCPRHLMAWLASNRPRPA